MVARLTPLGAIAALAAVLASAAAAVAPPAIDEADAPAWSPDARLLAFVYSPRWTPEGRAERIDVIDPQVSRRRTVVPSFPPGKELYAPDWSPDGHSLVFGVCCSPEVWVARVSDGQLTRVVVGGRDARWSPDGTELALISGHEELEVMRLSDSSRRVLAQARGHGVPRAGRRLAWSPDGTRIAYVDNGDLFVYSFAERRSARLTTTPRAEDNPEWAPDGSFIAYTSGPDQLLVRPDGSGRTMLYDDPESDDVGAVPASWSPDSRQLAFSHDGVWIVSREGRQRRRAVTRGYASDRNSQALSWSPDGRRIAYVASRMCPGQLPDALAVASVALRRARFLTGDCARRGTSRSDHIRGTPQNELLFGFAGDDVVLAAGGSDVAQGGRGNDWLDGGRGSVSGCGEYCDHLRGGPGDDVLVTHEASSRMDGGLGSDRLLAGPGSAHLIGGPGADVLSGGGGRDTLDARDGFRDRVRCGPEVDVVAADVIDIVAGDCERVLRRPGPR